MSGTPPLGLPFVPHSRAEPLFPSIYVHSGSLVPQFPHQQNKISQALPSSYLRQVVSRLDLIVRHFRKINHGNTFLLLFVMQQSAPPTLGRKQNGISKHS